MDHITPIPTHYFPAPPRLSSRSPSRSPSRRQHFTNHELNPLLSDLSPSSTLEALQANDILRTGGEAGKSFIQESVASASTSERAWGIKAALTGKKVREWYTEIEGWAWPGFDQSPLEEVTKRKAQYDQGHIDRSVSAEKIRSSGSNLIGKQNLGALSSRLIQEYEKRIEIIRDDLETLEIEDLKDYVRNTHFRASSRRSSLCYSQASFALGTDYDHLDEFTAVITATIVQALPTISRLETLLNTWSTRLLVLRQVPSFLTELDAGRESMVSASIAIGAHDAQHPKWRSDFSRKAFSEIRAVLQDQIAELGRRLDRMLDLLEGSADTLPDVWVDELDNMENQYSAWVVKAERLAMNKEIRLWKDYTQDHTEEILDLDRPLDVRQTTSTLDIGAQFDQIRRQADSDFDVTRQAPAETVSSENGAAESSNEHCAGPFDLDPFSSRSALPTQDISNEAQARRPGGNSAESQSLDGFSEGLKMPSLPVRSSHRPTPLILADLDAKSKRPNSPDTASDTSDSSGSGSATSNYSSNKSSPELQSAVVAEYMGSPVRVTSPTLFNREQLTQTEGGGANVVQSGAFTDLASKNSLRNGGPGHVRTRSASLQSFEFVPKHEIRRILVRRSGSYSSTLSLSDPEHGLTKPRIFPTTSVPPHGEPVVLCTATPLPASKNVKSEQPSAPAQNPNPRLDMPKQQSLYHPPPPVSVRSSMSARTSSGETHTLKQQSLYHPPPPVSVRSSVSARSSSGEFDAPKQQTLYHSPPPVFVGSSVSVQSSNGEFHTPKQQPLYHPPPPLSMRSSMSLQSSNAESQQQSLYHSPTPVSLRSSISAQSSDWESSTPKQQPPYHLPPPIPPRPTQPAQSLDQELDMAEHRILYHSPPPVPPRSAHRFEHVSDLGPGSAPVEIRQMKTSDPVGGHAAAGHVGTPRTTVGLSPSNFDDQLEERISSILTELPTQIRLTSGPEPDAPEVMRFNSLSDPRAPKTHSPVWRLKRTQTTTPLPSMTLAPAQPKSSKSRSSTGEPDIKLYHLHQTGKTAPIKLFVRLVGEGGERVMVRIGGGWADLGEYLREYASHHGRRSVPDSPFDIQGLPSSPLTNQSTPRSRPGSTAGSRPASRPGSRPASPTSSTRQSFANRLARQQTSPATFDSPRTPQSDPSLRNSPRMSWAATDEASPSLGLAGPTTKNVDISPEGQAWVDELTEQARQSGPEKASGSGSAIGDLGKVGGTKRVFFKKRKEG